MAVIVVEVVAEVVIVAALGTRNSGQWSKLFYVNDKWTQYAMIITSARSRYRLENPPIISQYLTVG